MSEIIFLIIGLLIGWLSKVPWLLWHYKHLEHTREVTRLENGGISNMEVGLHHKIKEHLNKEGK